MGLENDFTRREFLKTSIAIGSGLLLTGIIQKRTPLEEVASRSKRIESTPNATKEIPKEETSPTQTPELSRKFKMIEKYGRARTVPAFEYHGDEYSMFNGNYNMNQEAFYNQMKWLSDNDYYAATGIDLLNFINGVEDLPGRSVILTTDSGNSSQKSIPRMIDVLQETNMHFHSFIWTKEMNEGESTRCIDDNCWKTFRNAINSGLFTLGSHTETHRDFGLVEREEGVDELYLSKKEIENNLGMEINSISWPFEVCPYWAEDLYNMGYRYGFGGRSKPLYYCSVEKNDLNPWCLPRILPPNMNGKSGRPSGETLENIMEKFNKTIEETEG
jgi:peptidoglycan/xylan/chitin deacetylase (PgdA/CDA1 family)